MKLCKECQTEIPPDRQCNVFCNRSCRTRYGNKHRTRRLCKGRCTKCETPCPKRRAFCSRRCAAAARWEEKVARIQSGLRVPPKAARRFLAETKGYNCQICRLSSWQDHELVLIVDHINGNADDNTTENLRLLCPNCDSQTSTYKGRNKGRGRADRRQRYLKVGQFIAGSEVPSKPKR